MSIVREYFAQYGAGLLYTAVTAIAGFVGISVKNAYTRLATTRIKQETVEKCVRAVEQLFRGANIHGEEKYEKAVEYATALLAEHGVTISDVELKMLIEAALAELNRVFA